LLFVTDTLRTDALSCYGGPAHTPQICGLAERGVLFEAAYANGPWTPPSAVSIFTGNYPTAYVNLAPAAGEASSFWVSDDELLLGEALRESGYDVRLGSGSPLVADSNALQGFERLPEPAGPVDPSIAGAAKAGQYLRTRGGSPFFLLEWVMDPHAPYEARGVLDRLEVDASRLPEPLEFYTNLGHQQPLRMRDYTPRMSAYEVDVLRRLYLAEVERVDEKFGILMRELDSAGLRESTYVVFTSDHGEGFGEHRVFLHGVSFYNELVRVPLIVAGPGIARGMRVRTPVSLVDLMPTLRDLLAVECLNDPQGRSFRRLLDDAGGEEATGHAHYLAGPVRLSGGLDALVDGEYKLIAMLNGSAELYHLSDDPGELRNLAAERPAVVARMRADLDRIRGEKDERWRRNFAHQTEEERLEVHEQALEGLRELGYVE
jgi:choline-sulfatase